eukprot:gene29462-39050_t
MEDSTVSLSLINQVAELRNDLKASNDLIQKLSDKLLQMQAAGSYNEHRYLGSGETTIMVPDTRTDYDLKHNFHVCKVFGDASRFWLQGMHIDSYHINAPTIPEAVFCAYQLSFSIISSALICGSFAERMEYTALLFFTVIWHITVHCPLTHISWHPLGFLNQAGCLDYAGGCVIHIASGVSGLVCSIYMGKRTGWRPNKEFKPHNILFTLTGASMLWVGWFGFNAGSANGANERAGYALMMTQICTSTAALTWLITDWFFSKQPSLFAIISGAIAGLVASTPSRVFYADTKTGGTLLALQLYAVVISVLWAGVVTFIIILLLDLTIGVRVSE